MSSSWQIIGHRFLADLGVLVVELHFEAADRLTFAVRDGAALVGAGHRETVVTTMREVGPGLYFTSWQEASGATVTHFEDFTRGVLHSRATLPDGTFHELSGTITPLDEAAAAAVRGMDHEKLVRTAMHELFELGDGTAIDRYWKAPYVQHNPTLPNGLDALRAAAGALTGFSWQPHRIVAQGDLVIAHSRVLGWSVQPVVIADVFRIEDGRIAEHWDVIQDEVPAAESINGNPMV
ncbi:putative SnoaL-like aldol condensation-catalyzing enzyme [Streptomyces sp. 846.5]|nr:nuclear transport factor 2 family protein [Streptomyces sp. 846.5]TDT98256.1 putative SnoaL-like aldol condensation-catalyzing enzyme [Streptomyces sp. 846.5]